MTSIEVRVKDLLGRMTFPEKIGQLGSVYANLLLDKQKLSTAASRDLLKCGIGQIGAIGRTSGLAAAELAAFANEIQRFLVEKTRLGIPVIIHEECLNGFVVASVTRPVKELRGLSPHPTGGR